MIFPEMVREAARTRAFEAPYCTGSGFLDKSAA